MSHLSLRCLDFSQRDQKLHLNSTIISHDLAMILFHNTDKERDFLGFMASFFFFSLSLSLTLDQFLTLESIFVYFLVLEINLTEESRAGVLTWWNVLTTLGLQIMLSESSLLVRGIGPSVTHTLPLPSL